MCVFLCSRGVLSLTHDRENVHMYTWHRTSFSNLLSPVSLSGIFMVFDVLSLWTIVLSLATDDFNYFVRGWCVVFLTYECFILVITENCNAPIQAIQPSDSLESVGISIVSLFSPFLCDCELFTLNILQKVSLKTFVWLSTSQTTGHKCRQARQ